MKYKFRKADFWEELKTAIGDTPVNVIDSGDEIIFDFGDATLTPAQKTALIDLMKKKPMLRGKSAKFIEEGMDIEITSPIEVT